MKIASYETTILKVPEDEPLANMPETTGRFRPVIILRMRTDDGLEGIGVTFYGGNMTRSLCKAVEELAELTVGKDPMRIEAVIETLRATGDSAGPGGIYSLALSAIDTALWDIKGKALDQPLWKLLGGHRDRVPTYASVSKFPAVRRDIAVVVNESVAAEEIRTAVGQVRPDVLKNLEFFDVYRGEGIDPGKKSVALALMFQDDAKTLSDGEIDEYIGRIVAVLERDVGGILRG